LVTPESVCPSVRSSTVRARAWERLGVERLEVSDELGAGLAAQLEHVDVGRCLQRLTIHGDPGLDRGLQRFGSRTAAVKEESCPGGGHARRAGADEVGGVALQLEGDEPGQ
jgi:hypothetical protein